MTRIQGTVNGCLKRIYLDRKAAAEDKPAWVVEECYPNKTTRVIYHCVNVNFCGMVMTRGDKQHPLRPEGPAYWLETIGEVVCFLED